MSIELNDRPNYTMSGEIVERGNPSRDWTGYFDHPRPFWAVRGGVDSVTALTVKNNNIKSIELNHVFGFTGFSLKGLENEGFLGVTEIKIVAGQLNDTKSLEALRNLRKISISCSSDVELDFSAFPNLEELNLRWSNSLINIHRASNLKRVFIDEISAKGLEDLGAIDGLDGISISKGNFSKFPSFNDWSPRLKWLQIGGCRKLESLMFISHFTQLKSLSIYSQKNICGLDFVVDLKRLEVLLLENVGVIPKLSVLSNCMGLRAFSVTGRSNIPDDLTPLANLPHLSMLMFRKKKSQTHRIAFEWDWTKFDLGENALVRQA